MAIAHMIDTSRLTAIVAFLQATAGLKDTLRSGFTNEGRSESTAEHTWRLCLFAMIVGGEIPECDTLRLIKLCIVHDLGEVISGDIPAIHQEPGVDKSVEERADLAKLCKPLPEDLRADILSLWDEYNAAQTTEAILAKGLDKLETIFQQATGGNPPDFDYAFNLTYGAPHTKRHPVLQQLRELADAATRARING